MKNILIFLVSLAFAAPALAQDPYKKATKGAQKAAAEKNAAAKKADAKKSEAKKSSAPTQEGKAFKSKKQAPAPEKK